ncbi:MAG: sugar transferase, partial [Chloroflexota bacterium]
MIEGLVCRSPMMTNLIARIGGLIALAVGTLLVARIGGPAAVGDYALLRVLPWLAGVTLSGGLPGALPYFLAGPSRFDPRLRPTVAAMAALAGILGAVAWFIASPLIGGLFFRDLPVTLVALSCFTVLGQFLSVTVKACAQGSDDLPGSNLVIVLEELAFLPAYGLLLAFRIDPQLALIGGLVAGSSLTAVVGWTRAAKRGFFQQVGRPSLELGVEVYLFGLRGFAGTLMNLLNLRLDFAILAVLAGPATLGLYAVASKYAEFLRMLPVAMNWVLYPRYARRGDELAAQEARSMLRRAGLLTVAAAVPLAIAAPFVFPLVYGQEFADSTIPALSIIAGLLGDGMGGVVTAYLFGAGRPGTHAAAAAAGLAITAFLDVLLIPRFGAVGAACASAAAYLTTAGALLAAFSRAAQAQASPPPAVGNLRSIAPPLSLRAVDVAVTSVALALLWPLMLVIALAARWSTGGSAIFRQLRVGQGGIPFTLLKFRSMRPTDGPEITGPGDARVTRVGEFLRKTSLDELPQLINVLRGDMTLVGPR